MTSNSCAFAITTVRQQSISVKYLIMRIDLVRKMNTKLRANDASDVLS